MSSAGFLFRIANTLSVNGPQMRRPNRGDSRENTSEAGESFHNNLNIPIIASFHSFECFMSYVLTIS